MARAKRDAELGQRLVRWRAWRHIQQHELGKLLGLNRQRLWDWEQHGVPKSEATMLTLAMRELTRQSSQEF